MSPVLGMLVTGDRRHIWGVLGQILKQCLQGVNI